MCAWECFGFPFCVWCGSLGAHSLSAHPALDSPVEVAAWLLTELGLKKENNIKKKKKKRQVHLVMLILTWPGGRKNPQVPQDMSLDCEVCGNIGRSDSKLSKLPEARARASTGFSLI